MAIFPGAVTDRMRPEYRTPMTRYDAVVFHVAVSEALYPSYAPGTHGHGYVRRNGVFAQQIDTKYRAGTCFQGNYRVLGIETQGGVINPNGEPWTDEQVETLARFAAWANEVHGIPLQLMTDSKPGTRGIGYHRLGIDGNWGAYAYGGRVSGGELWSKNRGKICPGDAKIAQIPQIIGRARALRGAGPITPTPTPSPTPPTGGFDMADLPRITVVKTRIKGPYFGRIQGLLQAAGLYQNFKVDNISGPGTYTEFGKFQVAFNCGTNGKPDYVCGPKSWESLLTGKKW